MKYLGEITNTEDMVNKGYVDVGDSSIPFGKVDSTSTATAYTATVPGITELKDGVCMLLKNGVVTSAAGFTINVNGLGAKPSYSNMAAATQDTTIFNVAYTMLFVYDSTRVAGGCWICYRGYNSDNNTIGYQLRTNSTLMATTDTARYYKIYFTSADNTKWVPASANSTNSTTSAKVVNQRPINPFGRIVYTSATTNFAAGANLTATTIWTQYNLTLGYSFNRTGAALTLTVGKPVYVKCAPQADGSAIIDSTTPTVQDLPTTEDGKIYIYLGVATSATAMELYLEHPVYYYKDGAIRPWTNASSSGTVTETDPVFSASPASGITSSDITTWNGKQNALVSGTNIKTVNNTSLLGSGNVAVQPTLVSGTNIKTVNSTSLLGSGNVAVQPTLVSGTNIKTVNGNSLLGSGNISISGGGGSGWNAMLDMMWTSNYNGDVFAFENGSLMVISVMNLRAYEDIVFEDNIIDDIIEIEPVGAYTWTLIDRYGGGTTVASYDEGAGRIVTDHPSDESGLYCGTIIFPITGHPVTS